jgi:hypothetical protein
MYLDWGAGKSRVGFGQNTNNVNTIRRTKGGRN